MHSHPPNSWFWKCTPIFGRKSYRISAKWQALTGQSNHEQVLRARRTDHCQHCLRPQAFLTCCAQNQHNATASGICWKGSKEMLIQTEESIVSLCLRCLIGISSSSFLLTSGTENLILCLLLLSGKVRRQLPTRLRPASSTRLHVGR